MWKHKIDFNLDLEKYLKYCRHHRKPVQKEKEKEFTQLFRLRAITLPLCRDSTK